MTYQGALTTQQDILVYQQPQPQQPSPQQPFQQQPFNPHPGVNIIYLFMLFQLQVV